MGCSVLDISKLKNCCDIVVGKHGKNVMVEIKDGSKPPSKQKLTDGEKSFADEWRGAYAIVRSVQDAIDLSNKLAK